VDTAPVSVPGFSIIMPVYNEQRTVEEIIARVQAAMTGHSSELIVVDDASTDGTSEVLEKLRDAHGPASPLELQLIRHDRNRGKGAAIRTGLSRVRGEIILIQDADLEYDPRDYAVLLAPILEGQADVVFGNRFHGGPHRVLYFWHYVGNRVLTFITNILTGLNLSDMEVGYKAFRASVLSRLDLKSDRFGFEPEVTIKVAKLRCRIYEVPIRYYGRTYEEGKKITWRDAVTALIHIIRFRWFD
jgi:glycosyltransferase involved in cell wall biosynthesis